MSTARRRRAVLQVLRKAIAVEVLVFGKHNPNPAMNRAATALLIGRNGGSRRFWAGLPRASESCGTNRRERGQEVSPSANRK